MAAGWVAIYRHLLESDLWLGEPFTRGQAWIDLIMLARFEPGITTQKGQRIPLGRGELAWSEATLAKRWRWSRGKVRRYFAELEAAHRIVQRKSNVTSITRIVNYDAYQSPGTADGAAGGTADGTANSTARGTADGTRNNKSTIQQPNNVDGRLGDQIRGFSEDEIAEVHRRSQEILRKLNLRCKSQDDREALSKWVIIALRHGEGWLASAVEGTRLAIQGRTIKTTEWGYLWKTVAERAAASGVSLKAAMAKISLPEALKHSPEWLDPTLGQRLNGEKFADHGPTPTPVMSVVRTPGHRPLATVNARESVQ